MQIDTEKKNEVISSSTEMQIDTPIKKEVSETNVSITEEKKG